MRGAGQRGKGLGGGKRTGARRHRDSEGDRGKARARPQLAEPRPDRQNAGRRGTGGTLPRKGDAVVHRPEHALGHCPELATQARSALNSFFVEGGAMNFIDKSAITTSEYWLRVYRSFPNFAQ